MSEHQPAGGGGLIEKLVDASVEAGAAILEVYGSTFDISYKEDRSPLTEADRRSHELILKRLWECCPDTPVISEEGGQVEYPHRRGWDEFFLVDPLDGTKEFINRNGEFTVNIALIKGGSPVLGVVHVPVEGVTYYAEAGRGAYKSKAGEAPRKINVRKAGEGAITAVASRSHPSPDLEGFLEKLNVRETVSRGSSLKFCLVAEGSADVYPRLGPTWEWDTAAGHAVVEAAGGLVLAPDGNALAYNKESLKHGGFIVVGDVSLVREMLKS